MNTQGLFLQVYTYNVSGLSVRGQNTHTVPAYPSVDKLITVLRAGCACSLLFTAMKQMHRISTTSHGLK